MFLFIIAAGFAAAADARWNRMQSPNFEMYTTAGERSARDTLRYFEQVHSFFAQTMTAAEKPLPVRIVAFNSTKEYEPYRLNEFATAYYRGTADCDYIVMSHTGAETFPTAVHEYVHLMVRHAKLNFPPWLNEGVAELYSTLRPMGDKILVGSLIAGRHQALLTDKWVPLATILDAGHDSAYYNEKDKAGSLYNEGWALTHMLALDNDYRPKFAEVMHQISGGTPSRKALEEIYGKPLAAIEKDLLGYLRGTRFQGALIPAKLAKLGDDVSAEPAPDFDVKLLLTRIKPHPSVDESRKAFEGLVAADPKRPEPHVDLAYLFWSHNETGHASDEFAKAYELGARSSRLLWDYGRLAEARDPAGSIRALSELLKEDPDRLEVRLELAGAQLRSHAAKEAAETLKPVKKVTPDDAPRLLTLVAYANFEAGDGNTARQAAEQLSRIAQKPEDKNAADRILQALSAPRVPGAGSVATAASPAPVEGAPRLQRREALPMSVEIRTEKHDRASFRGKFVELQCSNPAKILLDTSEGKKIVMIDDPSRLLVNGNNGETMDLQCGRQKPVAVRIEYDPVGPNQPGIDGLARAIHFEK